MLKSLRISPPVLLDCVCPQCGTIYQRQVEAAHANSPYAWRVGGRLVILCKDCKSIEGGN